VELPFPARSFDLVTAIHAIHGLPPEGCEQAAGEIPRVPLGQSFLVADARTDDEERERTKDPEDTARTDRGALLGTKNMRRPKVGM
jgi:hypothetical protein